MTARPTRGPPDESDSPGNAVPPRCEFSPSSSPGLRCRLAIGPAGRLFGGRALPLSLSGGFQVRCPRIATVGKCFSLPQSGHPVSSQSGLAGGAVATWTLWRAVRRFRWQQRPPDAVSPSRRTGQLALSVPCRPTGHAGFTLPSGLSRLWQASPGGRRHGPACQARLRACVGRSPVQQLAACQPRQLGLSLDLDGPRFGPGPVTRGTSDGSWSGC